MLARSTRILLWVFSTAAVGVFLTLSILQLSGRPLAGPAEQALLDHAERLAAGQPLYRMTESRLAVPVMPGMPWLLSLMVTMFGPGLWEIRLLGLIGSLAAAALTLVAVRAETRSELFGLVGAGLTLAGFAALEMRQGPACAQPVALALGFGALCVLRFFSGSAGPAIAAVLASMSFYVHPLGAVFFAAGLAYLVIHHRGHGLIFAAVAAGVSGGAYVALSHWLGAWFNFNAWDAPIALMRFQPGQLLHVLGDELLGRLGILTFSAVLAFALPTRPWRGPAGLWMWGAFAGVFCSLLATQNARVSPLDLLPAVVGLAVVGPISAQRVTQHLAAWPGSSRLGGQTVTMAVLALQFFMLLAGVTAAMLPTAV